MLLYILLLAIFAVCLALGFGEGLWTNAIRLVNVVTAALLATNFWEPLAQELDKMAPSFTYYWDFPAIWILFAGIFWGLRAATEAVSRVKLRVLPVVDRAGGTFFAGWMGWVMVCFTLMTMHLAPLPRELLNGSFKAEQRMFFGTAPDRLWLGFVQKESLGSLGRGAPADDREKYVFDPDGKFLPKYAARRAEIERDIATTGSSRK